jgi:hypothetical protein
MRLSCRIVTPVFTIIARWITLRSSRMLPGQAYAGSASWESGHVGPFPDR